MWGHQNTLNFRYDHVVRITYARSRHGIRPNRHEELLLFFPVLLSQLFVSLRVTSTDHICTYRLARLLTMEFFSFSCILYVYMTLGFFLFWFFWYHVSWQRSFDAVPWTLLCLFWPVSVTTWSCSKHLLRVFVSVKSTECQDVVDE